MKIKKRWIILPALALALTALTVYFNRVLFPVKLKQVAVAQAEAFLKRKVEIESLRFNWVKGFIAERIKVYQKDSDQAFVQAERVSFGVIWIPGLKTQTINIPFLNIEGPSAHLVHTGVDQWNFSDLLPAATPAPAPSAAPATEDKPSPVNVSLAGIHVVNGHVRVDDTANGRNWSELVDNIQLKVGLSYRGITFDLNADLPAKKGLIAAQGSYQPLDQSLNAHVQAKNIRPAEYMVFAPAMPGVELKEGVIQEADVDIGLAKDSMRGSGDAVLDNFSVRVNNQDFQGSVKARHAEVLYKGGAVTAKGGFELNEMNVTANGIHARGSVLADVNQFALNKDTVSVDGNITLKGAVLSMADDQVIKGDIELRRIQASQNKDGIHMAGTVMGKDLDVHWGSQTVSGDITVKPAVIEIDNTHAINVGGDLKADGLNAALGPDQHFKGTIGLQGFKAKITGPDTFSLEGKLTVDDLQATPVKDMAITGSINLPLLAVQMANETLTLRTKGELNNWQVNLGEDKSVVGESDLAVDLSYPLKTPEQMTYSGSFAIQNAEANGFPFGPLRAINLDSTFSTDQVKIKLLSLVALDTPMKGAGTIMNFKAPVLNVEASCEHIDLSKIKTVVPDIYKQYGLETTGDASFNAQYQGLASDIASGKITATVQLAKASVASSNFNQQAGDISGTVVATLNSVSWDNFTATYMGNPYTLTGSLNNFKNPKVKTSLEGKDVQLKAVVEKNGDLVSIGALTGRYLNFNFDTTGTVMLPAKGEPVLDLTNKVALKVEDILPLLPADQRTNIEALKPAGAITVEASVKGAAMDWKKWTGSVKLQSPLLSVMGYNINNLSLSANEADQKISNVTLDATVYDGKVHLVGNSDLAPDGMPFDVALNIDGIDLHKLKMDNPDLRSQEINGKFYLTSVGKGRLLDAKNMQLKGSMAIRDGFLTEFKLFKGILSALNEGLKLGQVMITDVDGNFDLKDQKLSTDDLRLRSKNIVLITRGWANMDQNCNFLVTVDTSSGIIPPIALDVLQTLEIKITGTLQSPKTTYKISVQKVLNSVVNTLLNSIKVAQ